LAGGTLNALGRKSQKDKFQIPNSKNLFFINYILHPKNPNEEYYEKDHYSFNIVA
jgi:hypothetical protein